MGTIQEKAKSRIELVNKLKRLKSRISNDMALEQKKVKMLEIACGTSKGRVKSILKRDLRKKRTEVKRKQRHIKYIDKSINQVLTSWFGCSRLKEVLIRLLTLVQFHVQLHA